MLEISSAHTLIAWRNFSPKTKAAIASLFPEDNTVGRVHRMDQMPDNEKPAAFAHAYDSLADGRDLGRAPIRVVELAGALKYSKSNLFNWLYQIPDLISPKMILDLSGEREKTYNMRERRIRWALEFARNNGFTYLSLNEFLLQRMNLTRGGFNLWKKDDSRIAEFFDDYQDIVQVKLAA